MTADSSADEGWSRVHPLTPLISSWQALAVALVFFAQSSGEEILNGDFPGVGERLAGHAAGLVLVIIAVAAMVVALAVLSWWMTRYRITEEALELHRGVLFRQHRKARIDRLQAVDVVQPFVARLAGLARLTLEVAGGGDSKIEVSYLTERQATSLRNQLMARAAGLRYESSQAPQAAQTPVTVVPLGRLIGSLLLSGATVAAALVPVVVIPVAIWGNLGALGFLLPGLLGVVGFYWSRFNGGFDFRLATSADGLRLRHGLLEHRAQTVPPGRIQAVGVHQPWLWRGRDWWRIQINVAGYGSSENEQSTESVLLPVGERADVLQVLALVLPDLGVASHENPIDVVGAGLSGSGPEQGFVTSPRAARWLDPLVWRRTGFRVTDQVLLIRHGRLSRRLILVPHARTQSVGLAQGPLERRLGLVSFRLHSTPGPVTPTVAHLAADDGARLLQDQSVRARQARKRAQPERWMEPTEQAEG